MERRIDSRNTYRLNSTGPSEQLDISVGGQETGKKSETQDDFQISGQDS